MRYRATDALGARTHCVSVDGFIPHLLCKPRKQRDEIRRARRDILSFSIMYLGGGPFRIRNLIMGLRNPLNYRVNSMKLVPETENIRRVALSYALPKDSQSNMQPADRCLHNLMQHSYPHEGIGNLVR